MIDRESIFEEKQLLDLRIEGLNNYLIGSSFADLPDEDQEVLLDQFIFMKLYAKCLAKRI